MRSQKAMPIFNHFASQVARKSERDQRRITLKDIQRETGLSWGTVQAWGSYKVTRFDASVLDRLCKYFECNVGDLLSYAPLETESPGVETTGFVRGDPTPHGDSSTRDV
jgi:putative transcriptional regulator|tara:strand:+ start:202 stop:528 length:327 start_codon:yes stop_codon:yes gene_type:complete